MPRYTDGALTGRPYMRNIGFGPGNLNRTFDISDIYEEGMFNLSSGGVYFRVNNQNSGTDIQVWIGESLQTTSLGEDFIVIGGSRGYNLRFPRVNDGKYPETHTIAGIRIGTGNNRLVINPNPSFKLDHLYEINVTGTNASNMALESITEVRKMDLNAIFGLD